MGRTESHETDFARLEPIPDTDQEDLLDEGLLRETSAFAFIECYRTSSFPFVLLDHTLRIAWANEGFLALFGRGRPVIGTSIVGPFQSYLDADKVEQLFRHTRSAETGFSWRGRVEARARDFPAIIANLMISPLALPTSNLPRGYIGVLDIITDQIRSILRGTFMSLLEASRLKDDDTGQHVQRVGEYSRVIAQALYQTSGYEEIDRDFVDEIDFIAEMHDVGKIGTPDSILHKPGPLLDWEWTIMKEHTFNGAFILSTYPNPRARQIALSHHECWNGSGYPYALVGTTIPLAARIVAIADVYDALRMPRSYKPAYSHGRACEEILAESGTHFDPALAKVFEQNQDSFGEIFSRRWNSSDR